jgi:hypothetical protein
VALLVSEKVDPEQEPPHGRGTMTLDSEEGDTLAIPAGEPRLS